jgi:hypothetical protein
LKGGVARKASSRGYGASIAMSSATRPGRALITTTRWLRNTASYTLCVTNTAVKRCACHSASRSRLSLKRVISSSAANGSSSNSRCGCVTRARAIDARIFMPPDSSRGTARANSARPTAASAAATAASMRSRGQRCNTSGSATLSATLAQGISVGSWNTKPMRAWPSRCTVPWVGDSSAASSRSAVLLPQPDGPSRLTNVPASIARLTRSSACTPLA